MARGLGKFGGIMRFFYIGAIFLIYLFPWFVQAHPGATDAQGCHVNHKINEKHCHGDHQAKISQKPNQVLSGVPLVVDGDTIRIKSQKIRLFGIDAPESKQTCDKHGQSWQCGVDATARLKDLIRHNPVRCEIKDKDRYGRLVGICFVNDIEINAWMVRNGYAVAYRQYGGARYDQEEALAKQEGQGVWGSEFMLPEEFRLSK
jgi:endonuclease YncB( thermonuclease family)